MFREVRAWDGADGLGEVGGVWFAGAGAIKLPPATFHEPLKIATSPPSPRLRSRHRFFSPIVFYFYFFILFSPPLSLAPRDFPFRYFLFIPSDPFNLFLLLAFFHWPYSVAVARLIISLG